MSIKITHVVALPHELHMNCMCYHKIFIYYQNTLSILGAIWVQIWLF